MSKLLGFTIPYVSQIDGSPCVAVVNRTTDNDKTGFGLQVWYLHANVKPTETRKTGQDRAVCGDCKRRHYLGGDCYVVLMFGPSAVYRSYKRGSYLEYSERNAAPIARFVRGHSFLRLGSYGDPLSAPLWVTEEILRVTGLQGQHTGYTHLWRNAPALKAERSAAYLMASCDSKQEAKDARALGWSAYLATSERGGEKISAVVCPNNTHETQCNACKLCNGNNVLRTIVNPEHGMRSSAKNRKILSV